MDPTLTVLTVSAVEPCVPVTVRLPTPFGQLPMPAGVAATTSAQDTHIFHHQGEGGGLAGVPATTPAKYPQVFTIKGKGVCWALAALARIRIKQHRYLTDLMSNITCLQLTIRFMLTLGLRALDNIKNIRDCRQGPAARTFHPHAR